MCYDQFWHGLTDTRIYFFLLHFPVCPSETFSYLETTGFRLSLFKNISKLQTFLWHYNLYLSPFPPKRHLLFSIIRHCVAFTGEDLERNDGTTAKPFLMSPGLKRILGRAEQSPKKSRG